MYTGVLNIFERRGTYLVQHQSYKYLKSTVSTLRKHNTKMDYNLQYLILVMKYLSSVILIDILNKFSNLICTGKLLFNLFFKKQMNLTSASRISAIVLKNYKYYCSYFVKT